MITLTRINGTPFIVNAAMIELVESTPDTVITLLSSRKYVLRETAHEVARLVTEYYRRIGIVGAEGAHWEALGNHES